MPEGAADWSSRECLEAAARRRRCENQNWSCWKSRIPYGKDEETRARIFERSSRQSSTVEGQTGARDGLWNRKAEPGHIRVSPHGEGTRSRSTSRRSLPQPGAQTQSLPAGPIETDTDHRDVLIADDEARSAPRHHGDIAQQRLEMLKRKARPKRWSWAADQVN